MWKDVDDCLIYQEVDLTDRSEKEFLAKEKLRLQLNDLGLEIYRPEVRLLHQCKFTRNVVALAAQKLNHLEEAVVMIANLDTGEAYK